MRLLRRKGARLTEFLRNRVVIFFVFILVEVGFPFIVLGLFDFSLLRTHFCLITEYSVEFRAALRGNFARGAHADEDVPKGAPGSDNSAFRMTLAGRMPVTLVHASSASALAQRRSSLFVVNQYARVDGTGPEPGQLCEVNSTFASVPTAHQSC